MAVERLNREQFYGVLATLDEAALKKALWTLYWRGSDAVRERILTVIAPSAAPAPQPTRVDAEAVLAEVEEFASLARSGAYLARDRRVSPKERTRWRFTFQRLAKQVSEALTGRDVGPAASAMATLIDLACEARGYDYFRSEDPVEAARFVVSDAAAELWAAVMREQGHETFCELAAGQLLRWESQWGWTRFGQGWVSARETTLGEVVAVMLPTPDAWGLFAEHYLRARDAAAPAGRRAGGRPEDPQAGAADLSAWHAMLRARLVDGEYENLLDVLPHAAPPE